MTIDARWGIIRRVTETTFTAIIFPGQGSQRDGMRDAVSVHCPELLDFAIERMGVDPFDHIKNGTAYQQPALYCASIAGWKAAGSPSADFIVGHSLGELAAAAAAGAITPVDGLGLAVARGEAMQEAAESDPGGMLAVLGNTGGTATLAASAGLTVANDNAPGQVILSGPSDSISEARRKFREAGIKTVRLPVAGAFHSPAMVAAVPAFSAALDGVHVSEPHTTLLSSVTALPLGDIRAGLLSALTRPVRWRETVISLRDRGVGRFFESGPGDVLTNLVRQTLPGVEAGPLTAGAASHE